jgi:hypothetical protein
MGVGVKSLSLKDRHIDFFSGNKYIALPHRKNPRVLLALGSDIETKASFQIYNPFSFKAKILKKIALRFPFFNTVVKKKSDFIAFLEKKLKTELISSVYYSSCKYKVVLQLQSNGLALYYLKLGITDKGNEKVQHEYDALRILEGNIIAPKVIDSGFFEEHFFILIEPIKGKQKPPLRQDLNILLSELKHSPNKEFKLSNHPRVLSIKKRLDGCNMRQYLVQLERVIASDNSKYSLVYEHGDFTEWNMKYVESRYQLIDFEYFEENGIEGMDLCKFYYAHEVYVNNSQPNKVVNKALQNVDDRLKSIFFIFLLNEVLFRYENNWNNSRDKKVLDYYIKEKMDGFV